jgi:hypothetical protein
MEERMRYYVLMTLKYTFACILQHYVHILQNIINIYLSLSLSALKFQHASTMAVQL